MRNYLFILFLILAGCTTTKTTTTTQRDTAVNNRFYPISIDSLFIIEGFRDFLLPIDSLLRLKLDSFTYTVKHNGVAVTTTKQGDKYLQSVSKDRDSFFFHYYIEVPVHDTTIIIKTEKKETVAQSKIGKLWSDFKDVILLALIVIVLLIVVFRR